MGNINLLDCTLRDGGYINNWEFGSEAISTITKKLAQAGIESIELGFIKGNSFSKDKTVFPDVKSINSYIYPKAPSTTYIGMVDMSNPVSLDAIGYRTAESIDGIRVIFKKNKINEGFEYCKAIKERGFIVFSQLVGTDCYSDKEFVTTIEKFNEIEPDVLSIVDTFGAIRLKEFLRLVYLADNNLKPNIGLGYHSHNNLQQAFSNAQNMVELNLKRDIYIDACIMGMGRGAGNLNIELFAEYLNNIGRKNYKLEMILEMADKYISDIHRKHFWGYSLPYYISACNHCHPNYAMYFSEKQTLTAKSLNEIMRNMPYEMRQTYNKDNAEKQYISYMENYVNDSETIKLLAKEFSNKNILLLAPGLSIIEYEDKINYLINDKDMVVISLNFMPKSIKSNYVFSSNMRRYIHIAHNNETKFIITSNMKEAIDYDYKINFSSYRAKNNFIIDNSAIMVLHLLENLGIKKVYLAGLDGYKKHSENNYFNEELQYNFSDIYTERTIAIKQELKDIQKYIQMEYITPSLYLDN